MRRSLEESILAAAVAAIDPPHERKTPDGPLISHHRVVSRAEDALAEAIDTPIYVADLCKAAGVSERTLRNAFQSLYSVSPIRLLHLRRLHQVRRALRDDAQASVTEVALRFGFGNLGRFAVEYRQLFGESPSHTRRGGRTVASAASRDRERQRRRDRRAERDGPEPVAPRQHQRRRRALRVHAPGERRALVDAGRRDELAAGVDHGGDAGVRHAQLGAPRLDAAERGDDEVQARSAAAREPRVVRERDEELGAAPHFLAREIAATPRRSRSAVATRSVRPSRSATSTTAGPGPGCQVPSQGKRARTASDAKSAGTRSVSGKSCALR